MLAPDVLLPSFVREHSYAQMHLYNLVPVVLLLLKDRV